MLPEKIMQSDLLDILFENRNKTYGAYALRRSYNKTMAFAITITLFIATAFSVLQFIHHSKERDYAIPFIIPPDNVFTKIEPVKPLPDNAAPHPVASHMRQVISTTHVIEDDIKTTQMPTVIDIDRSIIGETTIDGVDATGEVQPPVSIPGNTGIITMQPVEVKPDDSPVKWAQVMPEYPAAWMH